VADPVAHHARMLELVLQESADFDVIHFHLDYLHFSMSRRQATPSLTTLHGRLDLPELQPLFRDFTEMPLVSISYAQRRPIPWANWIATIHHGLPDRHYTPHLDPGGYLAFLGRISPEKRLDRAIEMAIRAGVPLRIAAKVDRVDQEYFDTKIRGLLNHPLIEYVGEIGEDRKCEFLGNALALLFPIDWPEPFGLVMIEAMACGTPVIAWNMGSVPEILEDGVTGFLVNSMGESVAAIEKAQSLDRRLCRRVFEQRFSARRMALNYLRAYRRLCSTDLRSVERESEYAITAFSGDMSC
jgi:glycosyltransferase involved in cell wall biosynthesis